MERRHFLATAALGAATGLAGCSSSPFGQSEESGAADTPRHPTTSETPLKVGDVSLPVARDELVRGAQKDAIPAITEPAFGDDWSDVALDISDGRGDYVAKPRLSDDEEVIGVERNGEARAYPLALLNWHEVVNDDFGGPLLVTFCPLCGSGITAERTVRGKPTIFGVSGLLWNSDLVMYDERTGSLWSQLLATAIHGPRTGETLTLVPSARTTWGEWREAHPDTKVLRPPPESNTVTGGTYGNYDRTPYRGYENSSRIGLGENEFSDDRLHPKARVVGIEADGQARAYPLSVLQDERVVNDAVGDLPVVVAVGPDDSLVAYERRVGGATLEFAPGDDPREMEAGGSQWEIVTGRALSGPHEGTTLARANDVSPLFWFAWADFHPETEVYGQ